MAILAGILDLSKTYGGDKHKRLYLCVPDNKELPRHFIAYNKQSDFDKSIVHIYITFKFKEIINDHHHGILIHNIGRVESMENTYEYLICCKELNIPSIQVFNKCVISKLKENDDHIIEHISNVCKLPSRKGHIFTIDSIHANHYDDAISVKDNVVSIYISNVPILLDYFSLWEHLNERVSSIYLPNKKISMLPKHLNELCSLKERNSRICLVMDIIYQDGVVVSKELSLCKAHISRNYDFDSDKLLNHTDYKKLNILCKTNTPHDLIQKTMIDFNQQCANILQTKKTGIYKHHNDHNKTIQPYHKDYNNNDLYCHTTSPIRRIVDVMNMYLLCKDLYDFSHEAESLYTSCMLEDINIKMKKIRKLQYTCKLLSIFEQHQHQIFHGQCLEKTFKNDEYHYKIYLYDIDVVYSYMSKDMLTKEYYDFKLILLNDEVYLKRKLRLIIHTTTDCS